VAFAAVFAYEFAAGDAGAFEAAYGPDGDWARFFRAGEGYVGTELLRESGGLRYVVIDRWRSAAAYEAFLAERGHEYARRSRDAERLYREETVIGRFDLVSSAAERTFE
jgi:heme-degrading monooxygenase HmoA